MKLLAIFWNKKNILNNKSNIFLQSNIYFIKRKLPKYVLNKRPLGPVTGLG